MAQGTSYENWGKSYVPGWFLVLIVLLPLGSFLCCCLFRLNQILTAAPHATTASSSRTNQTGATPTAGYSQGETATSREAGDPPQDKSVTAALRAKVIRVVFAEQTVCIHPPSEANADSTTMFNNDQLDKVTTICSICIDPFQEGDTISTSLCDHSFHRDCILGWSQTRSDCPVCRQEMWDESTFNLVEQEIIMIGEDDTYSLA